MENTENYSNLYSCCKKCLFTWPQLQTVCLENPSKRGVSEIDTSRHTSKLENPSKYLSTEEQNNWRQSCIQTCECYGNYIPKICAQKNFPTFFTCITYVKGKWNSLWILQTLRAY